MARVFISYAGENLIQAAQLRKWLIEDGHEVFLDRDLRDGIVPGEEWEERLYERLRWADAIVSVITTAYVNSLWCTMELAIARSRGSKLVPIRAEPRVTHPALKQVQYADMTRDPDAARTALSEALRRVDQLHGLGWADNRSPFPGLRPFDTAMHRVFYGRDTDITQLANRLRSPAERADNAVLLLVGPSGCGKSSLLRAGLLPTIAAEPDWWTLSAFAPGLDPVTALVRELAAAAKELGIDWPVSDIRDRVDNGDVVELVDTLLLATPGPQRKRLLVSIDQFEELLVQTPPGELISFASVLRTLVSGPVSVVATVRPEFLDGVLGHPALSPLSLPTHTLRPLRREALRSVIEGPAKHAGLTVSSELVDLLVNDTNSGDALPLLAFALEQLAEGVSRGEELSISRYGLLGGVRGALTRQADEALAEAVNASGRSQDVVLASLLRLVTVDEQNRPIRWHVKRADLSETEANELDAFVAHRLLTIDTVGGDTVVNASHEAFFTEWPPLDTTIRNRASALRARRLVENAAQEWDTSSRPREKLWERGQLAGAMNAMAVHIRNRQAHAGNGHVSQLGLAFLYASVRRDRFRRRRLVVTLSVLLVIALAAATVAFAQRQEAQEQSLIATARLLIDKAEAALNTDPRNALMLSVAAYQLHPDADTYATVQRVVMTTPYAGELPGVDAPVNSISYGRNGQLAVGFESGAVLLWDISDPLRPRELSKPLTTLQGPARTAFSTDGTRLITAGADGSVAIWDLTDSEHPRTMGTSPPRNGVAGDVWLSPDGTMMATSDSMANAGEIAVQLWDLTDPAQVRLLGTPLANYRTIIQDLEFSSNGNMIATLGANGFPVEMWDISQRTSSRLLSTIDTRPLTSPYSLAFSPDGKQLAIGERGEGEGGLWDVTDPTNPRPPLNLFEVGPQGLSDFSPEMIFSPYGAKLATTGGRGTGLLLWDVSNPNSPTRSEQLLAASNDRVAAFSPDGAIVATGNEDGLVTLWNLHRGRPRAGGIPLIGHPVPNREMIGEFAITDDATMLAVGRINETVVLWDIKDPAKPVQIGLPLIEHRPAQGSSAPRIAFSPDGDLMVTSHAANRRTVLWDVRDPTRPRKLRDLSTRYDWYGANVMEFSPDGATLTVAGTDRTTVWDIRDPKRPHRRATMFEKEHVMGIWHVKDGRVLALLNGSGRYSEPTERNFDGFIDVTASRLWDITDATHPRQIGHAPIKHKRPLTSADVSADGGLLAISDESGSMTIRDISDPTNPRRIGEPLTPQSSDSDLVAIFLPQPGIMATWGEKGGAYLWDIGNPAQPRQLGPRLTENLGPIYDSNLKFSGDGKILASIAPGGDVILWDLTDFHALRRDPVSTACTTVKRGLNPDEWTRNILNQPYQNTCP